MRSMGRADSESSPTSSKRPSCAARIPASRRMSVPAFAQSIGTSRARRPRNPTPPTRRTSSPSSTTSTPSARTAAIVASVSDEAAETRDRRLPLADRPDQHRAVRDRLVPGHGEVPDQRGYWLDAHGQDLTSERRGLAGPGTIPRCGSSPASARPATRRSATTAAAIASTPRPRSRAKPSSASSTCTRSRPRTSPKACTRRRSPARRCSLRPVSTPSARSSSARATCRRTPRRPGCWAPRPASES